MKTGQERTVPILTEVVAVLRAVIGKRTCAPVFLREKLRDRKPVVVGDRRELEKVLRDRRAAGGRALNRTEEASLAKKLWWDAGAVKADKTSDRHLLDGRPHPGVEILTPAEFVERAGW